MSEIRPIYGQGFFYVANGLIYYTIVFDYFDPSGTYASVIRNIRARRDEENYIRERMQEFINSEKIIINGERAYTRVSNARLEIRGDERFHSAIINIIIKYKEIYGSNVYEDFYEPERAEYDYTVYWQVPPGGEILHVESPGKIHFEDDKRIAIITIRKGTWLDGYESIVFRLPQHSKQANL